MNNQFNPNPWFGVFLGLHILLWALLPSLVRLNLPLDSLEGATWGMALQWGYDKDPLLNAWLTRLAIELGGYRAGVIYLASQCAIAIGLFAVWRLARKFLPAVQAVSAVILLEGIQYYNIAAIDFNDNVLQVMLWPIIALNFYNACRLQKTSDWLWVGIVAGLAFLAKYYVVMLYIPMALFLVVNPKARACFTQKGLYLGILLSGLLIAPHIYWLFQHDFLTVKYSVGQARASIHTIDHLWQPIRFALMQFTAFLIPILLFCSVLCSKNKVLKQQPLLIDTFDKQFLLFIGVGPLIANLIYSALTGNSIHVLWGMPLLSLWGIILLVITRPRIMAQQFYRLFGLTVLLMVVAGAAYTYSLTTAENTSSANYPGRLIAQKVTRIWQEEYQRPLKYIAGPRWLAGNIAFYAPDHPIVYMEWNPIVSTWINESELNKQGAVFVWEMTQQPQLPAELLQRYPRIKFQGIETFSWLRTKNNASPIQIGVAILPPQ